MGGPGVMAPGPSKSGPEPERKESTRNSGIDIQGEKEKYFEEEMKAHDTC